MNVIGLVVSACIVGVAMSSMNGEVSTLLAVVSELSAMMMKITTWLIFFSPIGIFFLTVSQIIEMNNLHVMAEKLSLYLITVTVGILFHGFVILPAIFYTFTRQNPYSFIGRMGQAIVMAFGTASRSVSAFRIFRFSLLFCCWFNSCHRALHLLTVRQHYRLPCNAWRRTIK